MALPTWRAAGAFAHGLTSAVSVSLPTGHAANDILLLFTETSGLTPTVPGGWVEVTNSNQVTTTTITRMNCFWKRDGGAETDPISVTAESNHVGAIIHAFTGCETSGNPWNITAGSIDDTLDNSLSIATMNTTVNDCLIVYVSTTDTDIGTARWGSEANTNLGSLAERSDDSTTDGNGGGIGVWTGTLVTAGATGTFTATAVANTRKGFMEIALMPPQAAASIAPLIVSHRQHWN